VALFFCGSQQPTQTEEWLAAHCDLLAQNSKHFNNPGTQSNPNVTRAPDSGEGPHGNGWWSACNRWIAHSGDGTKIEFNFATPVQLNA
jgi:hypothetical protein